MMAMPSLVADSGGFQVRTAGLSIYKPATYVHDAGLFMPQSRCLAKCTYLHSTRLERILSEITTA